MIEVEKRLQDEILLVKRKQVSPFSINFNQKRISFE